MILSFDISKYLAFRNLRVMETYHDLTFNEFASIKELNYSFFNNLYICICVRACTNM